MTTIENRNTGERFALISESELLRNSLRTYVGLKIYVPIALQRGYKTLSDGRQFGTAWILNVTDADILALERVSKFNLHNVDDNGQFVYEDAVNVAVYQQELDGLCKFKGKILECVEIKWITKKDRRDPKGEQTRQVPCFSWQVVTTTKEERNTYEKTAKEQFTAKFEEVKPKEEKTEE